MIYLAFQKVMLWWGSSSCGQNTQCFYRKTFYNLEEEEKNRAALSLIFTDAGCKRIKSRKEHGNLWLRSQWSGECVNEREEKRHTELRYSLYSPAFKYCCMWVRGIKSCTLLMLPLTAFVLTAES